MARGISVTIGSHRFPTKAALTAQVRAMMERYYVGTFLNDDDFAFCLDLFRNHPEADSKVGIGVSKIEVRLDEYGHKHFQIHRPDETNDDISWVLCVKHSS